MIASPENFTEAATPTMRPGAMPDWITPELIARTKRLFGRRLQRVISDAEAVEILSNIANLMNAVVNTRRHS